MESTLRQTQAILVPSDVLQRDNLCFTISMKPHRRELIQSFIRGVQPEVQIAFSTDALKKDPCRLKIEKEKTALAEVANVSLNQELNAVSVNSQSLQKETMQIQTMGDFELKYNQEVVQGNCRHITPERYSIRIEVRKDPLPVYAHTIPSPDQQTSKLQTTVELHKGERIDLGGIVSTLKSQNHDVNLKPQVEFTHAQKSSNEKVFLSID